MELKSIIRKNIASLAPYSCARNEFTGKASVYLDANENPYNAPFNRYPDPLQTHLKERISALKGVAADRIFLGNGSDESIDLIFRIFCEPRTDNVVAMAPSYGMYEVCADINDVAFRKVMLGEDFSISHEALLAACDDRTKVIFVCSPNNPTGQAVPLAEIEALAAGFQQGIVAVDEAYIDFSSQPSSLSLLDRYPNLVVFQTFSKAWGCAALRLGMAFASKEIIDLYNKVKYPYNINLLTQRQALECLSQPQAVKAWVAELLAERRRLAERLPQLEAVKKVYPSDANFLLVRVTDADALYRFLLTEEIIVRNRNRVERCQGCLRITVGTPAENDALLEGIRRFNP